MRSCRVAITGLGLVSSLGSRVDEVCSALRNGQSGIVEAPQLAEAGLRSRVYAPVRGWDETRIRRRQSLTMSQSAKYATAAALDAINDAHLLLEAYDPERTALVIGSAFGGINDVSQQNVLRESGKKSRAGATGVVKLMASGAVSNVAAVLGFQGRAYSAASNAATGSDCVGQGFDLIRHGLTDVAVCGATEEDIWRQIGPSISSWHGMSERFNDRPEASCRPYDAARDGLVLSAGSGMLVMESLDQARRRGARIYAELVAYAAAGDGSGLLRPEGRAQRFVVRQALAMVPKLAVEDLDYVNTHGTGTPLGDQVEAAVLRDLFGATVPVSSTKGLSGHALGATGVLEIIYTLLMMQHGFVTACTNLDEVARECRGPNYLLKTRDCRCETAMSLSVGLGGLANCVILRRTC